ncbi:hypothetical protein SAMN02982929_03189 [Saccharopolyspora kobensis]|uniref:Tetratricopeptide repeat protein n=1 Tax=Saccharopolyspora kobensis TaxID=146035 RepID=A0A1H6C7A1_9PSEU|nr:hypothetical protein [Saccharopolyspora kobensis]SEG68844.1 hypothetical protein SAMN02982929_03189 [Saccharopolyspora kobensis]SFC31085.1 hypothetical protein SAMN05216506_101430 [Saccharopolyspora kobensis]
MALAGIELAEHGLTDRCRTWLERSASGEDPWLGPLAIVMLSSHFEEHVADSELLLGSLASQLTGDLATARQGFEQAIAEHGRASAALDAAAANGEFNDDLAITIGRRLYITNILLGNFLIQNDESAAALEPLRDSRSSCDGLLAAYASYLEAHVLIEQKNAEQAAEVLRYAIDEARPNSPWADGELTPWVSIRYGELLASEPWMDVVTDQVEANHVSVGTVVRNPFETALHFKKSGETALADFVHLFPGDFEPVHAALERLKTWSDERYERARRLVLVLHQFVEDPHDSDQTQGLAELRKELDLPLPR